MKWYQSMIETARAFLARHLSAMPAKYCICMIDNWMTGNEIVSITQVARDPNSRNER